MAAQDLPPEVLNRVFSYCSSHHSALLVCRLWSAWAIPHLWSALDSPVPLFALLAPLTTGHEYIRTRDMQLFTRDIEPDDWVRFNRYATFVRELEMMDYPAKGQLYIQTFTEVALTKPPGLSDLLPRLRRLTVGTSDPERLRCATLFLSSGLSYLHVSLFFGVGLTNPFRTLIKYARSRCRLTELSLDYPPGRSPLDAEDGSCWLDANGMENVTTITLPRGGTTGPLLFGLAQFPRLQTIKLAKTRRPSHLDDDEEDPMDQTYDSQTFLLFAPDSFPRLTSLTIDIRLSNIPQILTQPCFKSLNELNILGDARVGSFRDGLLSLRDLNLVTLRIRPWDFWEEDIQSITLESLLPITMFPNLRTFELWPGVPLRLHTTDFEVLAKGLPNIEVLWLGETGWRNWDTDIGPDITSSDNLVPFAIHCPNLRSLAFAFNASLPTPDPETLPRFKKLERLGVAGASIEPEDVLRMAAMIVAMSPSCPASDNTRKTIRLDADVRSRGPSIWASHSLVDNDFCALWGEVGRLANALMSQCMAYERRIRELEERLERRQAFAMNCPSHAKE